MTKLGQWCIDNPHISIPLLIVAVLCLMAVAIADARKVKDSRSANVIRQPRIIKYVGKRETEWKKQQARERIRLLSLSHRIGLGRAYCKPTILHGLDREAYHKD